MRQDLDAAANASHYMYNNFSLSHQNQVRVCSPALAPTRELTTRNVTQNIPGTGVSIR